jgi:hypothetical protein
MAHRGAAAGDNGYDTTRYGSSVASPGLKDGSWAEGYWASAIASMWTFILASSLVALRLTWSP